MRSFDHFTGIPMRGGLENIDFQRNDNFGARMESVIQNIRDFIEKSDKIKDTDIHMQTDYVNILCNLIATRFNMNIAISPTRNKEIPPSITFDWCMPNVLFYDASTRVNMSIFFKDYKDFIHDFSERYDLDEPGTVDLKTAKLGGIFSKVSCVMDINFSFLIKTCKLSNAEIVAVMLHEIGHPFSAFELANRIQRCNRQLMDLSIKVLGTKEVNKPYILKEITTLYSIPDSELNKILDSSDNFVMGYNVLRNITNKLKMDTVTSNDTANMFVAENIADIFANRFGYGVQVATGLELIMKQIKEDYGKSLIARANSRLFTTGTTTHMILNFILVTRLIGGLLTGTLVYQAAFMGTVYLMVLFISCVYELFSFIMGDLERSGSANKTNWTRENLKKHYKRIYQDEIEFLKDRDIPDQQKKKSLDNLKALDNIIDGMSDFDGIIGILKDKFFDLHKSANAELQTQLLLDELSKNEFFIRSIELSLIKKK